MRFVERRSRPLLIRPDRIETELFYYVEPEEGALITLGEWGDERALPTWREYYTKWRAKSLTARPRSTAFTNPAAWTKRNSMSRCRPEAGRTPWDYWFSPHAQAYQLLQSLDLGP